MSPSRTDGPATSTDAVKRSLASRPAEIETSDRFELHRRPSLGEVDRLADRLLGLVEVDHAAGLHAARFGMAEADAPRCAWLRRRSTSSCGGCGLSRAIRQTILLVPTSSAATSAARLRRHRLHLGRDAELQEAHASPPLRFAFLSFSASCARRRRPRRRAAR